MKGLSRRISFLFMAFIFMIVLSACAGDKGKEKEFTFIEKTDEYESDRLVFESVEDYAYYYVDVDGWEYDNFEDVVGIKENESINFKTFGLGKNIFELFFDVEEDECIELFGGCKRLRVFYDYKRK